MSSLIVDDNDRFISAYQVVNARVMQRQQALVLYVATALLAGGGNASGLGAAWRIHTQRLGETPVFLWIAVAATIVPLRTRLITPRWHDSPREIAPRQGQG